MKHFASIRYGANGPTLTVGGNTFDLPDDTRLAAGIRREFVNTCKELGIVRSGQTDQPQQPRGRNRNVRARRRSAQAAG